MSLIETFPAEVPADTRKYADPVMPADSVCRLLGDRAEAIIDESVLAGLYAQRGRGAINPVLLSFVLILQFLEKLPDRQAAMMCKVRLDWQYALRQPPGWAGFDYSSLCNFRKRLYAHGQENVIFEQVLSYLQGLGYLKSGRQRTDATHVLGAVERLNRLELVWETLRLALVALINADAQWVLSQLPVSFVNVYSQKRADFRLSKEQVAQAMLTAGQDGFWLLSQVAGTDLASLPEIMTLAQVLQQQYEQGAGSAGSGGQVKAKANVDATGDVIASPHDPAVRFSRKRDLSWQGYKLQVSETIDSDFPIINDIGIHSAIEGDGQALEAIYERLEERGQLPETHYVDQGYCNGKTLHKSQERGVNLRGRVGDDTRKPVGFRLQDFDIDLDKLRAVCPAGRLATSFKPSSQPDVGWHVRFSKQCRGCLFRPLCTIGKRGRSLEVSPWHDYLTRRRREQERPEFKEEMNKRVRIESTIAELTRRHGLRHSRYRGQRKVGLQAASTAAAVNLKRLAGHLAQEAVSFTRLSLAICSL